MKEMVTDLSIAVGVGIVCMIGFVLWIRTASENYANQHPEIMQQAQQSVEDYNSRIDAHNEKVKRERQAAQ